MRDFDVVVVGAGLGGLGAAVLMARAGLKVAVFERREEPGGVATTWRRGEYSFEGSLHLLDAAGPAQPNGALLQELAIADLLELRQPDVARREVWPDRGLDFTIETGPGGFVAALSAQFPQDQGGFAELMRLARVVHAQAWASMGGPPPDEDAAGTSMSSLVDATGLDVIHRFVPDPCASAVAGSIATYLGLPIGRVAALPFLMLLGGYHGWGGWYPRGGSRAITDALVRRLTEAGGVLEIGRAHV